MPRHLQLPSGNRRGPNCGITALAVAAEKDFEHIWSIAGETKPHNWKGTVTDDDIARVLRRLGIRYRSKFHDRKITLREFAERKAKPGVFYLMHLYDHAAIISNGVILDQSGYWSLKQKGHWKIWRAYEIQ